MAQDMVIVGAVEQPTKNIVTRVEVLADEVPRPMVHYAMRGSVPLMGRTVPNPSYIPPGDNPAEIVNPEYNPEDVESPPTIPNPAYVAPKDNPEYIVDETLQALWEIGEPRYRPSAATWRYSRYIDDPVLVKQLLTEATMRVLQGAGTVDLYAALEHTAQNLEARLAADENVAADDPRKLRAVIRTSATGTELLTQFGIPF